MKDADRETVWASLGLTPGLVRALEVEQANIDLQVQGGARKLTLSDYVVRLVIDSTKDKEAKGVSCPEPSL